MKIASYFLCLILILPIAMHAQDWKTVSNTDTSYFGGSVGYPRSSNVFGSANPHVLKVIFVDSSRSVNGDSVFHFYKTFRANRLGCIDTAAPSWLGRKLVRTSTGTEQYYNSFGDTITVKTKAALNDTWILAKDTGGRQFRATVIQTGVEQLEGQTDSIKTVSIQALQNGNPVANSYNDPVLQWSRNHGWVKVLDFYAFPNPITGLSLIDTGQHLRLNNFKRRTYSGLPLKYAVGNEWLLHRSRQTAPGPIADTDRLEMNTIISVTPTATNTWSVVLKKVSLLRTSHFGAAPFTQTYDSSVVTITVNGAPFTVSVPATTTPEVRDSPAVANGGVHYALSHINDEYFVDTFCNQYLFYGSSYLVDGQVLTGTNGCTTIGPGLGEATAHEFADLFGFDNLLTYDWMTMGGAPFNELQVDIPYFRLGSCIRGTHINIVPLGTDELVNTISGTFRLYPNPAGDEVNILTDDPSPAQLSLYDITGRRLLSMPVTGKRGVLSTSQLATGVYWVELLNTRRRVMKLQIMH